MWFPRDLQLGNMDDFDEVCTVRDFFRERDAPQADTGKGAETGAGAWTEDEDITMLTRTDVHAEDERRAKAEDERRAHAEEELKTHTEAEIKAELSSTISTPTPPSDSDSSDSLTASTPSKSVSENGATFMHTSEGLVCTSHLVRVPGVVFQTVRCQAQSALAPCAQPKCDARVLYTSAPHADHCEWRAKQLLSVDVVCAGRGVFESHAARRSVHAGVVLHQPL